MKPFECLITKIDYLDLRSATILKEVCEAEWYKAQDRALEMGQALRQLDAHIELLKSFKV